MGISFSKQTMVRVAAVALVVLLEAQNILLWRAMHARPVVDGVHKYGSVIPVVPALTGIAAGSTVAISQLQSTTGAGTNASWTGQSAKTGSNGAGGNIALTAGAGDGSGLTGAVQLNSGNGVALMSMGAQGGDGLQLGPANVNVFVGPQLIQFGSASTNPILGIATSSSAATTLQVLGQNAGGTNPGGTVSLQGGTHSGASQSDGLVGVFTPLGIGELEFTPSNGAQTLTNAQSDANILDLLAGPTAVFTINLLRTQTAGNTIIVRNNTSQTATIAYLTGGTVTVSTLTSAVIASTGTNLVKVMSGT